MLAQEEPSKGRGGNDEQAHVSPGNLPFQGGDGVKKIADYMNRMADEDIERAKRQGYDPTRDEGYFIG